MRPFALLLLTPFLAFPETCESLKSLSLPDLTIRVAQSTPAGQLQVPAKLPPALVAKLPRFCRVSGEIRPTADSQIQIEVWLPEPAVWNHRLQGQGNGGFAGSVNYNDLATALLRNYATASTDTGHQADGIDAAWAQEHPEKIADFGYRAIHLMTVNAKAIAQRYYSAAPQHSYFVGCSNGGRQALMEAQRFPADYDGIVAGAPANNWTHMLVSGATLLADRLANSASWMPPSKIPALARAARAACDEADGVKDGILNDPRACRFDPNVLLCSGKETAECLTAPQITLLAKMYRGGTDAKGAQIFPGFLPGAEEGGGGWKSWVTGEAVDGGDGAGFTNGFFRYMVFNDAKWTARPGSADELLRAADSKTADLLNAVNPDLSAFRNHGGKLILYHGWNDPAISALNTVNYYGQVRTRAGSATDTFVNLYMAPGMQHCYGGPGPSAFGQFSSLSSGDPARDLTAAVEAWVEKGTRPGKIIATKFREDNASKGVQMTRPLCVYPEVARYQGTGSTDAAGSFRCEAPR